MPLSLLALVFLPSSLEAFQSGAPLKDQGVIRREVNRVNVLVTATDKKGRFVTDLAKDDFKIFEDGRPQVITNFSKQTDLPLNIALLIDTSSSVAVKLPFEKDAATDFIHNVMRENDKALLVEFDTGVTLLQDLTSKPNEISRQIAKLRPGGGTSLYDAICLVASQKLKNLSGRKVIVLLSDGADIDSKATLAETLEKLRESDTTVYTISTSGYGVGGEIQGDKALRTLAEETGGQIYFPYSASQMTQHFSNINQELRSQYNIAYESQGKMLKSGFRSIKVRVNRDNIQLRHRKGYVAPAQG